MKTNREERARQQAHPCRNENPMAPAPRLPAAAAKVPRQLPNEADEQYALFVEYCRHGGRMTQRQLAEKCGVDQPRISRLLHRFRWVERVQMAVAGQEEKEEAETAEWPTRREDIRRVEYDLHLELIAAGREALARWRGSGQVPRPGEVVKFFELAERLGRLAAGLPLNHTEVTAERLSPMRAEFLEALDRVYGKASAVVIEVSTVKGREGQSAEKRGGGAPGEEAGAEGTEGGK